MQRRWAARILAILAVSATSAASAAPAKSTKTPAAAEKTRAKKASAKTSEPAAPRHAASQAQKPDEGESAELRMLRAMDADLFPKGAPSPDYELPWPVPQPKEPTVHATGLLPEPPIVGSVGEGERDLSWLRELELPDWPARWDARVIRYLEYYRDNPRGSSRRSCA